MRHFITTNTGTILGGEIDYSRGDSKNPLDAAKDNKLIKGFVDELLNNI